MDEPKNIVVITKTLDVGGTEQHLALILPELINHGWDITCLVLQGGGPLQAVLQRHGIVVRNILGSRYARIAQKLPRCIEQPLRRVFQILLLAAHLRKLSQQIILHFFLPEPYILGMFCAMLVRFKGPTIMSRRSLNNYHQRRPWVAKVERFLHRKVSMATGNSQAVINQLLAEGFRRDQVRLIYNAANTTPFVVVKSRRQTRERLNLTADALVLILVANLISYKGHLDLLQALSGIKDELPEKWCLFCVGRDDGIGASLQAAAEKLGLADHILWLGSRADVADLLSAADIGLLCSHEEGFSNAILEGMVAGLPMVVTDVGGNKEAVVDGKTGWVVPAKDPVALRQAILKLIRDPQQAQSFGLAGKARVAELFALDTCVQGYLNLYQLTGSLKKVNF